MQLLQVLQLGTLDYSTALKLQETLVELRSVLGAMRQVDEAAPRAPAPTLSPGAAR